jgi:hypothetical protein
VIFLIERNKKLSKKDLKSYFLPIIFPLFEIQTAVFQIISP